MFRFLFFVILVAYNALSLAPMQFYVMPLRGDTVYYLPVVLGAGFLLSVAISSFFMRKRRADLADFQFIGIRTKAALMVPGIALTAIFFVLVAWANRNGLVVSDYDARFGNSGLIFLLEYILLFFSIVLFCQVFLEGRKVAALPAAMALVLVGGAVALGYRSPLVIFFGSVALSFLLIEGRRTGGLKMRKMAPIVIAGAVLMTGLGMFAQYRIETKYNVAKYYREYDIYALDSWQRPFLDPLTMMRADQYTVVKLVDEADSTGIRYGQLFVANWLTLLPGEQLGVRNIVGGLTTTHVTEAGKEWSITPTIQGALYLDGGIFGVFLGGAVIGFLLTLVDRLPMRRPTPVMFALSSFIGINICMLVHTGYPDAIFYLVLILFSFVYRFSLLMLPKSLGRNFAPQSQNEQAEFT